MLRKIYRDSSEFLAQLREELAPLKRVVHDLPSESELFSSLTSGLSTQITDANAAYRINDRATAANILTGYFRQRENPAFFISSTQIGAAAKELQTTHTEWVSRTLEHADRMAKGAINAYAQSAQLGGPEDWATAPTGPVNDILYRYRPHRFAFAPRLALAHLYGHEGALPALGKLLGDWAASVRTDAGFKKKYRTFTASSHVALYRSIAVSWTLAFLSADSERHVDLELLCLRIILGDGQYINACLPHTTRNNHLLADGFGLWYLGSLFPEFENASTWKTAGMEVFRRELLRQIYPDGTSFEQSVHYQEHACEMGLAYLLLCRRNHWPVDDELAERIRAMLHFQATLTGADGTVFAFGDTTEDPLFPLDGDEAWCSPALRSMYGNVFGVTAMQVAPSIPSLERAFWLSGGQQQSTQHSDSSIHDSRISNFRDGGFAVLTARGERDRLVWRTGPAPDTELVSGHMHFDFLSIALSIDGQPIIVPGGTYSYRATPRGWIWKYGDWRRYFMSARGASGLILSDSDPLQRPDGDFPGGIRGDIACRVRTSPVKSGNSLTWISAQVVGSGEHAGWERSILQVCDDYWLVLDELANIGSAVRGWFSFQFPTNAQVEIDSNQSVRAVANGIPVILSFSEGLGRPQCLKGSSRPAGGWISNRYGEISAAPQLLVPTGTTETMSACVISGLRASSPTGQQVSVSRSQGGFEIQVDHGEQQDRITLKIPTDRVDAQVRWSRMENGQTVVEESI